MTITTITIYIVCYCYWMMIILPSPEPQDPSQTQSPSSLWNEAKSIDCLDVLHSRTWRSNERILMTLSYMHMVIWVSEETISEASVIGRRVRWSAYTLADSHICRSKTHFDWYVCLFVRYQINKTEYATIMLSECHHHRHTINRLND